MRQTEGLHPIVVAREGMTVHDADGEEIGTVSLVKMSDPGAITSQGQDPDGSANLGATLTSPAAGTVPVAPATGVGLGGLGPAGGVGTPYAAPVGVLATGTAGAAEPDVPEPFLERLLRTGYLKVDSKGLFRRDLYVGADQLSSVRNDIVTLTTTRDKLIKED